MAESLIQVGKYRIVEQVGEGAMGVVYRAIDPVLNRSVAIKVMTEALARDEELRARFLREAQAAGSLQHPNVVTVYDFGEVEGHLFIAMEFIRGADLEQLLKSNAPLTLDVKLDLIIDVLNGLGYAHRRGIVHRDIKPANVRVDEEGRARIMDFGVAHLASSKLTKTGFTMGTPDYMAPEQITGGELTPMADLFSVGSVLYELLTNTKPFQADTLHGVLYKVLSESPRELSELKPELPPALSEIVRKALAKDPTQRYQSALDMANALNAVRASLTAPRLSKTISLRNSIEVALQAQRRSQEHAAAIRRWRVAGGGLAAALVFAVGAVLLVRRQHPSPPPPSSGAVISAGELSTRAAPPAVSSPSTATVAPQSEHTQSAPQRTTVAAHSRRQAASVATAANSLTTRPRPESTARRDSTVRPTVTAPGAAAGVPSPPTPGPIISSPSPAPAAPAPSTAANAGDAITAVVAAYAQAINTRNVDDIRRVYPGITTQQRSAWTSFFSSIRSINATLTIASLDQRGSSAVADLTGIYEYVTSSGRAERQPVKFQAVLQHDADRWVLQSVR